MILILLVNFKIMNEKFYSFRYNGKKWNNKKMKKLHCWGRFKNVFRAIGKIRSINIRPIAPLRPKIVRDMKNSYEMMH